MSTVRLFFRGCRVLRDGDFPRRVPGWRDHRHAQCQLWPDEVWSLCGPGLWLRGVGSMWVGSMWVGSMWGWFYVGRFYVGRFYVGLVLCGLVLCG